MENAEGWHGKAVTEGVRGVNLNRRSHPQKDLPLRGTFSSVTAGGGI